MVNDLKVAFIIISIIFSILIPVFAVAYSYKKFKISFKALFTGALIFIVFALILESTLHSFIFKYTAITHHPYAYAFYGACAAAIFEEFGRLIGFKIILKKYRNWKDGLSYGLGHGGAEAIIIGGISNINNLIYSLMINSGSLEALKAKLPVGTVDQIKNAIINTPSYMFLISGFERLFAFTLQIALSILVLYSVKSGRYKYFIYALLLHFITDIFAALYQAKVLKSIFAVEIIVFVIAVFSFVFIVKSKKMAEKIL
ncbi:YhfC family intramembrane metalloprotease [Thermoanaerobacterium sp. CMT5567-10]|uniref:YhfC family intramembrane metalloprotease n=1 Tax=Thermoanaerobacterium sp. CMT5567-10 TaxID=3061989 RepID=UPI0026E0BD5F|nr:YhfC family intramembrane metalloprotease [Thermoanaerobacterium sp. CMT5567-10]WKV08109.1 YhfC family intramembrane metalloprotease [Thermoanaerobacterium sp. CMT5567-10]